MREKALLLTALATNATLVYRKVFPIALRQSPPQYRLWWSMPRMAEHTLPVRKEWRLFTEKKNALQLHIYDVWKAVYHAFFSSLTFSLCYFPNNRLQTCPILLLNAGDSFFFFFPSISPFYPFWRYPFAREISRCTTRPPENENWKEQTNRVRSIPLYSCSRVLLWNSWSRKSALFRYCRCKNIRTRHTSTIDTLPTHIFLCSRLLSPIEQ